MKDKVKVKIKGVLDLYDEKGKVEDLQLVVLDIPATVVVYTKSKVCCGDEYLFEAYDEPVNLNLYTGYSVEPVCSFGVLSFCE